MTLSVKSRAKTYAQYWRTLESLCTQKQEVITEEAFADWIESILNKERYFRDLETGEASPEEQLKKDRELINEVRSAYHPVVPLVEIDRFLSAQSRITRKEAIMECVARLRAEEEKAGEIVMLSEGADMVAEANAMVYAQDVLLQLLNQINND